MCEHKNLRTVGDRLFCKDCKQELPLEFLLNQCKPEEPAEVIEEGNLEAEEILEDKIAEEIENQEEPAQEAPAEPAAADPVEETLQEAPQDEQETGGNAPVSEEPANDKPKKKPAKTGRKTAKKGA